MTDANRALEDWLKELSEVDPNAKALSMPELDDDLALEFDELLGTVETADPVREMGIIKF